MLEEGLALNAPAKVNLALHVTGRRADLYHLIDSIAVFADVGDRIEIIPAGRLSVSLCGPFAGHAPGDRTDLAWRAAEAFFAHAGSKSPVAIRVEKNIPAGAGLGGGSADAAAVLAALDLYFETRIPPEVLSAIGLTLGADVPMCLLGGALRARGIGEEIERLAGWPSLPLLLVWPGRAVSTVDVFRTLQTRENPPLPALPPAGGIQEAAAWLARCRNDLERPALALSAEIGDALGLLRKSDCLLARMSGSGSACFGLYADLAGAEAAAAALRKQRPGWWIESTLAH